jgi:hypothetical protein
MPGTTQAKPLCTRRDGSSALVATLTSMLQAGEVVYEQANLADTPNDFAAFRRLHHRWVLECLPNLERGFGAETAREFLRANVRPPGDGDVNCARGVARTIRDPLELLHCLRATLADDA